MGQYRERLGWQRGEVMGKRGVSGDKGVSGEDGVVEKAAQLLCSAEVLLWGSVGKEEVLRFQFLGVTLSVGISRNKTQYIPLQRSGRGPRRAGNGAGSS